MQEISGQPGFVPSQVSHCLHQSLLYCRQLSWYRCLYHHPQNRQVVLISTYCCFKCAASGSNLSRSLISFYAFFRRTQKVITTGSWSIPMSAPGNLLVLWMFTPDRKHFSPKCNQPGCGVFRLGCSTSIF